MTGLEQVLRQAAEGFEAMAKPWALVGGLAVSARTEPRFTRDVDVAVMVPDDGAAEQTVQGFRNRGFQMVTLVEQDAAGRLATVRMRSRRPDGPEILLDLLFASSGIEPEICADAESLDVFPGLTLPVATSHHLLALKILARDDVARPQDAADIRALLGAMGPDDVDRARAACRLIMERGYHRDRNLLADLDQSLRE